MSSSGLGSRFWNLWTTFTSANLGDGFSLVAFPLLAVTLTDDARAVALVSVFRFLPFLLLGLPAGVLLDRFDRRVVSMVALSARAAAMAVMAVLVASDSASIPLISVMAFLIGTGEIAADSNLPAMVQGVVDPERLEIANSRLSATQTVSNVLVGPPLGALFFAASPTSPFALAAALYLGAAGLLWRLPGDYRPNVDVPQDAGEPNEANPSGPFARFRQELTVGLRYVWSHPVLRPLALSVALFAFVGEAGNAVFVILATERFGLSEFEFGLLIGLDGVVSVIMSFFVAGLVRRTSHSISMRFSVVTYVLAALLFGTTTVLAGIVLAAVFSGLSDPSWNVISGTVRQRLVPKEIFARMMTAYLFIAWGMQPFGALLGGVIAEQWGPQWVYLMSGAAVGSLLVLARPMFRAVDAAMQDASASATGVGGED